MTPPELTVELKKCAQELGFALNGVCPAVSPHGITQLARWLAAGYAGEMSYLADRFEAYRHPRGVLDGVRSLLMLGTPYRTRRPSPVAAGEGRVSCYAWGAEDYHDVIHRQLRRLGRRARQLQPSVRVRGVVDTAPLLEREFAQLAGLGWVGKNTMLLNRRAGSWFVLSALLLDCELDYDAPFAADHCGSCTACLDACPTAAFPEPYVLDATRCISYLTIELRGALESGLRPAVGEWLFGCDMCQDVCPWNRNVRGESETFVPQPDLDPVALAPLFQLNDDAFRQRFRHTPLWRARRRGLLRNAAVVMGNRPTPNALPALVHGLRDVDALVRGASAWALGRLPAADAATELARRLTEESDPYVQEEIRQALETTRTTGPARRPNRTDGAPE
jgi:epoxyqueuosine reductase